MKRTLAALAVLALAAPALASEEAGAAVFKARCASCHGPDGSPSKMGEKMGAPDLKASKAGVDEMEKTIAEGKGKMMGYKGKLSQDEIHEVAEYVKKTLAK